MLTYEPSAFSLHGYGQEYFVGFDNFPWFRKASLEHLFKVEFSHGGHLYWPDLDIDLDRERFKKYCSRSAVWN
jgi:hypothetical protein